MQAPQARAADAVTLSYLDGQNPVAPDAVTAYGTDLFGDKVNLFNGALEFEHTDLSLPGNSKLPVALVRHHTPGQSNDIRGQFGDWDLEAPRIGGTFTIARGWVTTSGGTNRCSGFSLPPKVSMAAAPGAATSPFASASSATTGVSPAALPTDTVGFIASDYWRRTSLVVPGAGNQEVLKRASGNSYSPGNPTDYPLVTHGNWQIGCLPTLRNGAGEGFFAVSPQGVRYRFDWMATRLQTGVKKSGAQLGRIDIYLMATEVTDRFGNWVRYTYDPGAPWLLIRIEGNDGRVITITSSGGLARSATDGTRTYSYFYGGQANLSSVQQPDGSRWTFNLAPMVPLDLQAMGESANCDFAGAYPADLMTGTVTHPSGAVGTFATAFQIFGRTQVDRVCNYAPLSKTVTTGAVYPKQVVSQALMSKQITGPGLPMLTWQYKYVAPSNWSTCTTDACKNAARTVTVTEPTGGTTRHTFGNRWRVNEGQLLRVDEGWDGTTAVKSTAYRYRQPMPGQPYPDQFGASLLPNSDWLSARHRPQDQRVVSLQGSSFAWEVDASANGFDFLARPQLVRKYSSLGYSRTESTQYFDATGIWVLGQVARVGELTTGVEIESSTYNPATALVTDSYSFGKKTRSYAYNADGTIAKVFDAAGRPTQLSQWKRGKPQYVTYPDLSTESQVVNNLGLADSKTDAAGKTTGYLYDSMGRVAQVNYPGGDPVAYFPIQQAFAQINADEFGLPAGHWRQTISTGGARKLRYFDGLWRKRLELVFDANLIGATTSYQETRYDLDGRKSFESYPQRDFTTVDQQRPGVSTYYDAIDRVVLRRADSELGNLDTVTSYPAGAYQRTVTNPRQFQTTYTFQAFDTPTEDSIAQIHAPEGVVVAIVRDPFGKPSSITRGGATRSVTRSYVYDLYQRLCKTVEPETAATIQDYDLAGNVAWRASGVAATGLAGCDLGAAPAGRKLNFGYDARDRLTSTTYGDGSDWVSRSYEADGALSTVRTPSFFWQYRYNNRRVLTSETLTAAQGSWSFGYGIDEYGHVASITYPDAVTLPYVPDALGRPTMISAYLTGVAYHPNGALAGYSAVNGIAYSMTQNVRGLPYVWQHGGVVRDVYGYDANGNVISIVDQQEGVSSRSMGYDGLDRLTSANGAWGSGSYAYDAVDNLISSQVGTRALSHNIDGANRLASLTGSLNLTIGYDLNGNIIQRGSQGFQFDIGNRMQAATGVASYAYDGHGRRAWTQFSNGRTVLRIYGLSGRLLWTVDSLKGQTRHVHLGDKIVAESNTVSGSRWLHTDALGSPVAATTWGPVLLERTRYEPYGRTAAGTNPDGVGFTGHVNDPETGLVYMQQRYYEPLAGRFLSVDPVTTDAKTGGHINRYVYGENSPYKFKDPDGQAAQILFGFVVGGISGLVGAANSGAKGWDLVRPALVGAAVGAATAAVPIGGAAVAAFARNAIGAGAANAAGQKLGGADTVNTGQVATQALIGGVGGVVGNAVGKAMGIGLVSVESQGVGTTAAVASGAVANAFTSNESGGLGPAASSTQNAPANKGPAEQPVRDKELAK